MKAGRVVYIRVNPKNCMSCIDVVQKVALVNKGMSFAQVVSMALSVLLETMRKEGAIPTRDGYEYMEMMQPWAEGGNTQTTVRLNRAVELQGSEFIVPALPMTRTSVEAPNHKIAQLEKRIVERHARNEADPLNADHEEITRLNEELRALYAAEVR